MRCLEKANAVEYVNIDGHVLHVHIIFFNKYTLGREEAHA